MADWRVFTTEKRGDGYAVVSTRWNEEGPTDDIRTMCLMADGQHAALEAQSLQADYDAVRRIPIS